MSVLSSRGIWAVMAFIVSTALLLIGILSTFVIPSSEPIDQIMSPLILYTGFFILLIGIILSPYAKRDFSDIQSILNVAKPGTTVTIENIRMDTGLNEDRIRAFLEDLLKKRLIYGHFEGNLFVRYEGRQNKKHQDIEFE